MSGRSGWGGWPPQPIPGTARPGAVPTKHDGAVPTKGDDDTARDTIDTARGGTGDTTWHPPTPPPAAPPEAGQPAQ